MYWRRASNGGVVELGNGRGLLIDTGADAVAAEALAAEVIARGWSETFIINTHNHHDHTAGNELLVKQAGATVLDKEKRGQHGLLCLGGPAAPPVFVLPMPGHSADSIGIRTGHVFWTGDALFAPEVLRRIAIPALTDVGAALQSLDDLSLYLKQYPVQWGVAGHGRPMSADDFRAAIAFNRGSIYKAMDALSSILPANFLSPEQLSMELTSTWLQRTQTPLPTEDRRWRFWRTVGGAYSRELSAQTGP